MPDTDLEANDLFLRAVEMDSHEDRRQFLDDACAGKPDLRDRINALIRAGEQDGSFLEHHVRDTQPTAGQGLGATAGVLSATAGAGTSVGPYKLVREIGEGGMGTVFLAQQSNPVRRLVAVKLIKLGMDSREVLARFEAERQALAMMDHPNIARVLDAGATADGRPYFVMELVKGVPITRYCDEHRLDVRERLSLFASVCRAVQHAHQKGVIHRDLKPSNVLVAPYDGKPVVKVIDFGVAKAAGGPLTNRTLVTGLGTVVGTPEYMSPEQAEMNNLDIDTRSDIYALGTLLYELLTGTTPLTRARVKQVALLELMRIIREEEPPRPSTRLSQSTDSLRLISSQRQMEPARLRKLVRGELDWIVMKALEKDRNRRYETANALAMEIQRYLSDEPVQACPPSMTYRLRKVARRNKGLLTAAVVVFLTLITGTAIATWQAVRATLAEGRALAGFRMARDAVDRSFMQANESPLLKGQGLEKFRRDQLQSARDFYEQFVREEFDAPEVRFDLGLAHHRLAEIDRELGNFRAAEESAAKAVTILGALAEAHPNVPAYRRDLAAVHVTLGLVYSDSARWNEAEAAYGRAIAIQEKQVAAQPESPRHRCALAKTLTKSAFTLIRSNREDAAVAKLRQALEVLNGARQGAPDLEQQSLLAETHMNLGQVNLIKGQYDGAEAALKEAIRLYEELVRGRPGADLEVWQALARSRAVLGSAYNQISRFENAEEVQQQALQVFEKLAREHPDVQAFAYDLGRCYQELGRTAINNGRPGPARARYDKAIGILEGVLGKGYVRGREVAMNARIGRAGTFGAEGNHARATDEAEALAREQNLSAVSVYDIACLFSRSSATAERDPKLSPADQTRLKARYADRAMAFLRDAAARGYAHPLAIKADPDLKPLQAREDFKALIAELEAQQKTSGAGHDGR
jgi:serine/threonine protein kinase